MGYLDDYIKADRSLKEKESFDFLITDLLSRNLRGVDKQRTLTAHNMEEFTKNKFIPSMFYIIMYAKADQPEILGDNEFYDVAPLIFCTNVNDKSITGINFNFIPSNYRALILDTISESSKNFYDNVNNSNINSLQANINLGSALLSEQGLKGFLLYIQAKTKIDLSPCIRSYKISNIVNSRLIEYDEWGYIPYLNFKDSVRGASIASIQKDVMLGKINSENKKT
jgi:hypothetical protein